MPGLAKLNSGTVDYWINESIKDIEFDDEYVVEESFVKGPFAKIHVCQSNGHQTNFSVKVLQKYCRLKDIYETIDKLFLVSEHVNGKQVLEDVSVRESFSERDAAKILKQVLEGLKHIHDEGMIHKNLKPENILIQKQDDGESCVKITDVVLNSILGANLHRHNIIASVQCCAPELLRNESNDPATDIWSFGVFAYILLCGDDPFRPQDDHDLYKSIFTGEYVKTSSNYQNLSVNAKDFLSKLLIVDPKKRLTANQALENLWLTGKATKFDNMPECIDALKEYVEKRKAKALFYSGGLQFPNGDRVNIVQKHLSPDCWNWFSKKTTIGSTIVDCVKAAIENPDCEVGLYASDPECYETFSEIFMPVISEYHGIDASAFKTVHDYGDADALIEIDKKYSSSVLMIRFFAPRTLADYPMASKLNREKREQIEELAKNSFKNYHSEFYGDYYNVNELSNSERDKLIESNFLFENATDKLLTSAGCFNDWPLNRGMFMSRNRNFIVWVNEEDHLKVISVEKGANMAAAYSRLLKGLNVIEKNLSFLHHENLGYLNFSPTNIGTGMRVCVQLKLPNLSANNRVEELCESFKLSVTDMSTTAQLGVYEVSNRATIGLTEIEIANLVWDGVKNLLNEEFA